MAWTLGGEFACQLTMVTQGIHSLTTLWTSSLWLEEKKKKRRPRSGMQVEVHPNAQALFSVPTITLVENGRDMQILVRLLVALSYVE